MSANVLGAFRGFEKLSEKNFKKRLRGFGSWIFFGRSSNPDEHTCSTALSC
jgi:hypothetical protein